MHIDHVNIVVTDLERMLDFYTRVLGLVVSKRVTISGDWIGAVVGLSDVYADVVYLELKSGPRIELIRYNRPALGRIEETGRPNLPGLRHIALNVNDLDGLVARLRENGVQFFSPVQTVPDSQVSYADGARKRLVYFRDPEGNVLELCEYS